MITVSGVNHRFTNPDGVEFDALRNIDITIEEGEFVAIVGPSGCGKTTLLNMLAGLEHPTEGTVEVAGERPVAGDSRTSYVLARDSLLPWRTAKSNAGLGLELQGVRKAERERRAAEALDTMGLAGFHGSYASQLSHGMRQRVALARSFAARPQLLLMDEPFSALDAQTRLKVHDAFLQAWDQQQMTVVLITHDLQEAVSLADRVVIMTRRPGRLKAIHHIDLPRPRSISNLQGDDAFHRIYEAVWRDLQDEFVDTATTA